ncbi:unnamed protein product [Spodoptera exigua]|nr:unnamed protein product [Spodoptera exigua]
MKFMCYDCATSSRVGRVVTDASRPTASTSRSRNICRRLYYPTDFTAQPVYASNMSEAVGRYLMKYVRYDWQTNSMAPPYVAARAPAHPTLCSLTGETVNHSIKYGQIALSFLSLYDKIC